MRIYPIEYNRVLRQLYKLHGQQLRTYKCRLLCSCVRLHKRIALDRKQRQQTGTDIAVTYHVSTNRFKRLAYGVHVGSQ